MFKYVENITIDAWGGDSVTVNVSDNIQELSKYYCKFYKLPKRYNVSDDCQASFVWAKEPHHQSYTLWLDTRYLTDRVIVHEVAHCCFAILDNKGVKLKASSEEAYCYLLDYLFDKVQGIVKQAKIEFKKYKKDGKSISQDTSADNN